MTRRHLAAILITTTALGLAACGTQDASTTSATNTTQSAEAATPTPASTPGDGTFIDPTSVDRSDVDATAEAAAMLLHSWDTTTDKTQTAAAIRAKPLMSKDGAAHQI